MAKKEVEETSLAGRAWNATKDENDPDWGSIPNSEFKGKLEFAAERVKETGTAKTNFEIAVKELAAEDAKGETAPMAVVNDTPETSAMATPIAEAAKPAAKKAKAAAKKAAPKKAAAKAVAAKTDKSGHVPTAKETAAAVDAEKNAPLHP